MNISCCVCRSNTVEETTFHLLHISLLREYLDLEFASVKHVSCLLMFSIRTPEYNNLIIFAPNLHKCCFPVWCNYSVVSCTSYIYTLDEACYILKIIVVYSPVKTAGLMICCSSISYLILI